MTEQDNKYIINKLTALWAFSESVFGGILHAIGVPFKGIALTGVAIIIISLISKFSSRKGEILKATIIVAIIKAVISPHTPPTAYLSIAFQGLLGELLFFKKKTPIISIFLLSFLSLMQAAFQRVIVLTFFYGENLWNSIDTLANYIYKILPIMNSFSGEGLSRQLILFYVFMHIAASIAIAIIAFKMSVGIKSKLNNLKNSNKLAEIELGEEFRISKKKRSKLKVSHILILAVAAAVFILTFYLPDEISVTRNEILIMLFRAVFILLVWYNFAAPLARKFLNSLLKKKQSKYAAEVNNILGQFPYMKKLFAAVWKDSAGKKGIVKWKYFIVTSLTLFLISGSEFE